jgi:hypothetical protein
VRAVQVMVGNWARVWAAWIVAVSLCLPGTAVAGRRGGGSDLLDVVVLPFAALSGRKAQADAKEALELELELVDNVRVQASEAVEQDLEALGEDAFEARALSGVLKRRGVEVLVAVPPGLGRTVVVAFANDGKPRVVKDMPRGAAADQLAVTTMAALKPALSRWAKQKPVPLPSGGAGSGRGVVDDEDILAEVDRSKPRQGGGDDGEARRRPSARDGGRGVRGGDDDDDAADAGTRRRDGRGRDASGDDDGGRARRRSGIDDEDAPRVREEASTGERQALDASDDDTLGQRERRSLTEVEDDAPSGSGPVKATHLIALAAAFDGATWRYNFEPTRGAGPNPVTATFFPGGSVHFDLWPWESVGLDASGVFAAVPFEIPPVVDTSTGVVLLRVEPSKFTALQFDVGGALRGRYLLRFGDDGPLRMIGLGGRLGYRYWSTVTETQVIEETRATLTVVPGFTFHALAVGPELYVPIFVADRRFEFELKLEGLPATLYEESPDNPGGKVVAFGYHAELVGRFDVLSGVFVQVSGKSTGATIAFEGAGDRVTLAPGTTNTVVLQGGNALSFVAGFNVGVGFMY